jgi:hypothetical protein
VYLREITIGKLVARLCVLVFFVVHAEMPARICGESVLLDVPVLLFCRRLMLAACISLVDNEFSLLDQRLRVVKGCPVQPYGH